MIFYCAGEFTYKDLTVKADKACALMVKIKGQNEMKLHIADPGQTQSNITIDIRMRKQSKQSIVITGTVAFMPDLPKPLISSFNHITINWPNTIFTFPLKSQSVE